MTNMNLLFYSPGMYAGGVASAFRAIAAELEAAGHSISLVVPHAEDVEKAAVGKRWIVGFAWRRACSVRWVKRLLNAFNIWTGWWFYFAFVKKRPCDRFCLFLPTPDYQWARYVKNPAICWLHALAPKARNDFTGRMWRREIKRELDRFGTLVAVSPAVAESWKREYSLEKDPVVVPNLIDCGRIRSLGAEAAWPFEGMRRRRIVCVGRVSPEKGQMRLLEAIEQCENVEAVFVGDGSDRGRCERFVADKGLASRVAYDGTKENPYPYISAADVTVVPSLEEGFGLVPVESVLLGTPVIATDCGGTRFALRDGRYGMLVENSTDGISQGIRKWLADDRVADPKCGFAEAQREIEARDTEARKLVRLVVSG